MCGGDNHLARKHPISLEVCRGLRTARGYNRFCQGSFNPPILFYRVISTLQVSLYPIRISFLHVGASVDLQSCLSYSWVRLPSLQSHFGMMKYEYQFEYTQVVCLITFQLVPTELFSCTASHPVFPCLQEYFRAQSGFAFMEWGQRQVDQSIRSTRPESRSERYGLTGSHC